jgi:hypothetical protein
VWVGVAVVLVTRARMVVMECVSVSPVTHTITQRVAIRNEFTRLGLNDIVARLKTVRRECCVL